MAAIAPAIDERLEAYADLAVRVGANVQEGQTVFLNILVEHAPLGRALTRAAYRAGARYVDMRYRDDHVRHAMIELGPDEALTHSPEWMKMLYTAMEGEAQLWTTGDPEPELMNDLDGERVGRARMKEVIEIIRDQMVERSSTGPASPTRTKAGRGRSTASPTSSASGRRSRSARGSTRPTPCRRGATTWRGSRARGKTLNELGLDAIHYTGPGTDLTVGLNPNARWMSALFRTRDGIEYVPNMPTEEVFTTPDCRRAEGTIRSSRPLVLDGDIIQGLQFTVKDGEDRRRPGRQGRRHRARPARDRRPRRVLRRARARRRHLARRPDEHHVLRHALRRERDVPHRLRLRRPRGVRRRPGRGHERLGRPHGLHGRRAGARRRRDHEGRPGVPILREDVWQLD